MPTLCFWERCRPRGIHTARLLTLRVGFLGFGWISSTAFFFSNSNLHLMWHLLCHGFCHPDCVKDFFSRTLPRQTNWFYLWVLSDLSSGPFCNLTSCMLLSKVCGLPHSFSCLNNRDNHNDTYPRLVRMKEIMN